METCCTLKETCKWTWTRPSLQSCASGFNCDTIPVGKWSRVDDWKTPSREKSFYFTLIDRQNMMIADRHVDTARFNPTSIQIRVVLGNIQIKRLTLYDRGTSTFPSTLHSAKWPPGQLSWKSRSHNYDIWYKIDDPGAAVRKILHIHEIPLVYP